MAFGFEVHSINQGRLTYGEYHHLFPELRRDPKKFQEYTRLQIKTFDYVLGRIQCKLEKNWCNLHSRPIFPEEQLVVTLRFLATGSSYGALAFNFRMGVSTICGLIDRTLNAIWKILYPVHMPVPTEETLLQVAKDFYEKCGLPHCLGAIDARHVRIRNPNNGGSRYFNYKGFFSIVLQAVVDSDFRYMCIDVGGYGRQHDATTLRSSSFYAALERNIIKIPSPSPLPGSNIVVPYFFIADGAYPLLRNLLKPYRGSNIPDDRKIYNEWVCGTRIVAECAFGQTCQRWRIFYTTIQCEPKKVELITKVTCLLHNVIIDIEGKDVRCGTTKLKGRGMQKVCPKVCSIRNNFRADDGRDVRERLRRYLVERY